MTDDPAPFDPTLDPDITLDPDAWLTRAEVAKILGVEMETVSRWCRRGYLRRFKIGAPGGESTKGLWRCHRDDLVDFIAASRPTEKE